MQGDLLLGPPQPVPFRVRPEPRPADPLLHQRGRHLGPRGDQRRCGGQGLRLELQGGYGRQLQRHRELEPACNPLPPSMVDPIFEYPHGTIPGTTISNANCITGGAFVPNGVWPAAYNGLYLDGRLRRRGHLQDDDRRTLYGVQLRDSAQRPGRGSPAFASVPTWPPRPSTTRPTTGGGQVRRITTTVPVPPTAVASSDVPGGPTPPVVVTFSGAGSTDPVGLPLTYMWDFGDGSAPAADRERHGPAHLHDRRDIHRDPSREQRHPDLGSRHRRDPGRDAAPGHGSTP